METEFPLFDALRRHGVPFVIVGGHAVNFHGYTRATDDSDVVWLRTPEAEQALLLALSDIDAHYIGNDIDPATGIERLHPVSWVTIQTSHLMMLWTKHGFFDLFDHVPGYPDVDVNLLFHTSEDWNGMRVTSLEWLRQMKRAAGRGKDMTDLENLPEPTRPTKTETPPETAG